MGDISKFDPKIGVIPHPGVSALKKEHGILQNRPNLSEIGERKKRNFYMHLACQIFSLFVEMAKPIRSKFFVVTRDVRKVFPKIILIKKIGNPQNKTGKSANFFIVIIQNVDHQQKAKILTRK